MSSQYLVVTAGRITVKSTNVSALLADFSILATDSKKKQPQHITKTTNHTFPRALV